MNASPRPARAGGKIPLALVVLVFPRLCATVFAQEVIRGLDFWETSIRVNGPNVTLDWNSSPGSTYQVQSRTSLTTGNWATDATIVATGGCTSWTDPAPAMDTRYYRLFVPGGALFEAPPARPPGAPGVTWAYQSDPDGDGYANLLTLSPSAPRPGGSGETCGPGEYADGDGYANLLSLSPLRRELPAVHGFSGEFVCADTDLRIPGRGPDFIWARKYRSRVGPNTAQGNGWDFSYNIFIESCGQNVVVHDGNTRQDVFFRRADGTYAVKQMFSEGSFSNGVFILKFADTGTWEFRSLDGSAAQGKINRSTDRNGNSLSFAYDVNGRLVTINDTLNRNISVGYNADGFISTVTDFTGRQVVYSYYQNSDTGGSFGDLKSVRSPIVNGTPNGNDFPSGKTTTYTYSKGFGDERLNHNLLTITDPLGQTWLRNEYDPTIDPTDIRFDRTVNVYWGDLNEVIKVSYAQQTPAANNNNAVVKAIVNDRVGNVSEHSYDAGNRLVLERDFTGRATPGVTTTEVANRPINPLRTNDPPYFEVRCNWNADSLLTLVILPNSNQVQSIYEEDLNPAAAPRVRENLRELIWLPGPLGGDQPALTNKFEHLDGFGSEIVNLFNSNAAGKGGNAPGGVIFEPYTKGFGGSSKSAQLPSFSPGYRAGKFGIDLGGGSGGSGWSWPVAGGGSETDVVPVITPPRPPFDDLVAVVMPECCHSSPYSPYPTYPLARFGYGGSCFVTNYTDARSNMCRYRYDPRGNRTYYTNSVSAAGIFRDWEYNSFGQLAACVQPPNGSGVRRRDEFSYYNSGPQNGYLQSVVVDSVGNALTATYEYDARGNLVRHIDPRGHDTLYDVNQLNQVVLETSREVTDGSGIRYLRNYFYDGNNNLVRTDRDDKDENGIPRAGSPLTTTLGYDILNRVLRVTNEVAGVSNIVTEFQYDANRNRTLVRFGEAVSGGDPNNVMQMLYDERRLQFRTIGAPGGADQSTTQYDYDPDGNLRRTSRGLESAPREMVYAYDGYDRRTLATDAMGNVATYHYDANGNVVSNRVDGELTDVTGSAGNVRLSETVYQYDAMNRLIRRDRSFFDPLTQLPISDGQSTTQFGYDGCSHFIAMSDDLFNQVFASYDSANRLALVTDAKSNTVAYTYDANGNVTRTTEVDRSDLTGAQQSFQTTYTYDNLDRRIRAVDNVNNTNRYAYDSLSRRVLDTDAHGRATRYVYDGLSRLVQTVRDMNTNGPNALEAADVVTTFTWDESSRRTSQTDDNTNTTVYAYDSLNRRVRTVHADGTTNRSVYDPHGNRVQSFDPNGTVVTNQFDGLNRLTNRTVARGPSILGTANEAYQYDGLSRLVRAQNQDSVVTRRYDSLSDLTLETQQVLPGGPVRTITATYDGVGNELTRVYPGGRALTTTYDSLNRAATISDAGGLIASYKYNGPGSVEQRDYGNGTRQATGYDGIRRVTGIGHLTIATLTAFEGRAFTWDRVNNKTFMNSPLTIPPEQRVYAYDAMNRLVRSQIMPVGGTNTYTLDGVGNRTQVTGNIDPGLYSMSATLPEPADSQMNQYTTTSFDSRGYDKNGNLVGTFNITPRNLVRDYRNQLVQFSDPGAGVNAIYKYDCLGRRLEKNVNGTVTRFYSFGGREIEEQNAGNTTVATFVWGNGRDELLTMTRSLQNYYFHADDLGGAMKVTDSFGNVVEGYTYADYGVASFFNGSGSPILSSTIGNPYLFRGMRLDPENGLLCIFPESTPIDCSWLFPESTPIAVMLDPRAGRTLSRGSGSEAGAMSSAGAVQASTGFAGNNPVSPGWVPDWTGGFTPHYQVGPTYTHPMTFQLPDGRMYQFSCVRGGVPWPGPDLGEEGRRRSQGDKDTLDAARQYTDTQVGDESRAPRQRHHCTPPKVPEWIPPEPPPVLPGATWFGFSGFTPPPITPPVGDPPP